MILDQFKLDGNVAVVTGACTGLGMGMATALAEAGADIVAVHHHSKPDELLSAIRAIGRRCICVEGNLAEPGDMARVADQSRDAFGKIDILLNNAGIIRRADFLAFTEADWDEVMNVNLKSMFLLSQAVARGMIERKIRGKIINIASLLSFQGGIRVPSYTASKHGVMGLTKIMANELASHGINVNGIAPGYMATANTRALREDPVRNEQILSRIPAGRWGRPEDLAGAAVFLASRASDYMQGETIAVDGGWLSR